MRSETVIGRHDNARPRARRRFPFFREHWNEKYGWSVAAILAAILGCVIVVRRDRRRGDRRRRHHHLGRAPQPLVQRELVAAADPGRRGLHACGQRPVPDRPRRRRGRDPRVAPGVGRRAARRHGDCRRAGHQPALQGALLAAAPRAPRPRPDAAHVLVSERPRDGLRRRLRRARDRRSPVACAGRSGRRSWSPLPC